MRCERSGVRCANETASILPALLETPVSEDIVHPLLGQLITVDLSSMLTGVVPNQPIQQFLAEQPIKDWCKGRGYH